MMNQVNKQLKKLIPVCMIRVGFLFSCTKDKNTSGSARARTHQMGKD
jgi:hypothetical protein